MFILNTSQIFLILNCDFEHFELTNVSKLGGTSVLEMWSFYKIYKKHGSRNCKYFERDKSDLLAVGRP